ncbi:hypothetical protein [Lacrimispora sp.]|nr:hypothetical protein [Lacrimispora sp.]
MGSGKVISSSNTGKEMIRDDVTELFHSQWDGSPDKGEEVWD